MSAHPEHCTGLQEVAALVLHHGLQQRLVILWEVGYQRFHLFTCAHPAHIRQHRSVQASES